MSFTTLHLGTMLSTGRLFTAGTPVLLLAVVLVVLGSWLIISYKRLTH